jgi:hypothetical protein
MTRFALYPYKGIYRDLESAKVLLSEIPTLLNGSVETPGVRRKAGVEDRVMNVYGKRYRIILEEGFMRDIGPVWYIKHFKPYQVYK